MFAKLYQGDCLEIMKNVDDNSVDLILADLPYGTTDRKGKQGSRIFEWDNVIPMDLLWEQYKRVIKKNGVIVLTADQPFTSQLVLSNLEWFKYEWIWKKNRTTGFFTANYRPMKCTEDILIFSEGGAAAASVKNNNNMTYNPQDLIKKSVKKKNNKNRLGKILGNVDFVGKNNKMLGNSEYEQKWTNYPNEILEFSIETDTIHPTQKPIPLMEYLIKTYSNENELVLDNVMGSGTTGIAAINCNRNFIGIEKDITFFELSNTRINDVALNKYEVTVIRSPPDSTEDDRRDKLTE